MSEHYDFHYQPTGSGAISGQQVLEQTEDAINELGDYVNDNVGGAMDVAQQALETAQNAEQDAQTALDTANSFSSAIQSAQQDASTALSTAQTAQTTASNANNTAIQAQQDASNAVTTANNASGQVNTLSGTVTALGQRVTTAEGNIGQNTSNITAFAEGNITTLQNDVTIAQGNASSAMATAGQVKQQAFVFRYSSTALTASSTNSNTLLDNTDNLKVGDKVIDSSAVLFSITAIDTQNSTFTIGTALIDLAQDSDVVHKSGDETVGGVKTFSDKLTMLNAVRGTDLTSQAVDADTLTSNASGDIKLYRCISINGASNITHIPVQTAFILIVMQIKYTGVADSRTLQIFYDIASSSVVNVYTRIHYNGTWSNWVKDTDKFVTTDTAQTISGNKTFTNTIKIKKEIELTGSRLAYILPEFSASYSGLSLCTYDASGAIKIGAWKVDDNDNTKHVLNDSLGYLNISIGSVNNVNIAYITPRNTTDSKLGDPVNKWKTFNGLEPSSLSLPSGNANDVIDISSYLVNLDGTDNTYVAPANGWITIKASTATGISCTIPNFWNDSRIRTNTGGLKMLFPILKGQTVYISIYATTVDMARFIPCQGNV